MDALKLIMSQFWRLVYIFRPEDRCTSKSEYASMPELFHLDNFDRCMMLGENALYCMFQMQLSPLEEGSNVQIWQTIQRTTSNVKDFRHDLLRYGICVPLSCPNIAQNVTGYNDDSHLREGIDHCYASELKELGLKGYVTQLNCITEKPLYNIDSVDIVVG
ncbi:hypothetical protein RI129_002151 [Pyrocoelia pectoralis]|uniref:Uncharacterized protein n=1 Tax=Pyrocoelia pectoralis TaxID=417401 RepID=A0AAN7VIL2_9COLE